MERLLKAYQSSKQMKDTAASSSPPGFGATNHALENSSLDQLIYELALRLIGPEKAKSQKNTGWNLSALCQALTDSQSTPGFVQVREPSITPTLPPTFAPLEWVRPSYPPLQETVITCQNPSLKDFNQESIQLATLHG